MFGVPRYNLVLAIVLVTDSCLCYPTVKFSEDVSNAGLKASNDKEHTDKPDTDTEEQIKELIHDISELSGVIENMLGIKEKTWNEDSTAKLGRLKRESKRKHRPSRPEEVAFQAVLMNSPAELTIGDTIVFDDVVTNDAHAYNDQNGVFTAPVSGTYFFSTTIVAEIDNYIEASIYLNDTPQVTAVSGHKSWDQGTTSSVLKLMKGDQVKVSILWPRSNNRLITDGKSSFCGYLLSHSHGK